MNRNGHMPLAMFGLDPRQAQRLHTLSQELTANAYSLGGRGTTLDSDTEPDDRRNVYDECGFPRIVKPETYQRLYDREPIPARVVECFAKEAWQVSPSVYEDEDSDISTEFEREWYELGQRLEQGAIGNWHEQEESSGIWEYLQRGDILSGIGRYGVVLLGLDDGQDSLSKPVGGVVENGSMPSEERKPSKASPAYSLVNNAKGKKFDLLYMRPFPELQAQATRWETNKASPRFGQPVQYLVTFHDSRDQYGIGQPTGTESVHWTRVVHLADTYHTAGSSEMLAIPRMQPVLNHLLNTGKIYHPSAEGYWKSVFSLLALSTHPQLGGDVDVDESEMRDVLEQVFGGLQRYLFLRGMDAKSVTPSLTDPSPHVAAQLEAICIKLGIPIRIFKGSERGNLASAQDDGTWKDRLRARQRLYMTPKVVARFINHLIFLGVLPQPKRFVVDWPDLAVQTDDEKATVGEKRTRSIVAYSGSDAPLFMQPMDFYTRIIGFTDEEARAIVDNSTEAMVAASGDDDDETEEMDADDNS